MHPDPTARPLVKSSIELIHRQQASTGAYTAAPGYGAYAYSWLRDGAFIAAAMDGHGHHASAGSFHTWVARTVERHEAKVKLLEAELEQALAGTGDPLHPMHDRYVLHTRFAIDGEEGEGRWGNFQLDGYGFWLTSLASHLKQTGADLGTHRTAVDLVGRYLSLTWECPCYDSWEEYPTRQHTTTWAAIARGLHEAGQLTNNDEFGETSAEITRRLVEIAGPTKALPKFVPEAEPGVAADSSSVSPNAVAGHERVGRTLEPGAIDGGALLVLGSFGPFGDNPEIAERTVAAVESQLVVDGGVHRYLEDEYYGGGLWIVLAGALASCHAGTDPDRAEEVLQWIEAQADSNAHLAEQTDSHLRRPSMRQPWIARWGQPANPLLWSHAMYLLSAAAVA